MKRMMSAFGGIEGVGSGRRLQTRSRSGRGFGLIRTGGVLTGVGVWTLLGYSDRDSGGTPTTFWLFEMSHEAAVDLRLAAATHNVNTTSKPKRCRVFM